MRFPSTGFPRTCLLYTSALDTGNGICLCLTGGEAPHVGGVVLAAPRPSLTGQGNSCDLWTATVPGHKDVYLAQNCLLYTSRCV